MYKKTTKKIKETTKFTDFRFWNNGKEYICRILSSINIPKYRLKEAFDRNFIGKKDVEELKCNIVDFKKLDSSITYEVKLAKEFENVR